MRLDLRYIQNMSNRADMHRYSTASSKKYNELYLKQGKLVEKQNKYTVYDGR